MDFNMKHVGKINIKLEIPHSVVLCFVLLSLRKIVHIYEEWPASLDRDL